MLRGGPINKASEAAVPLFPGLFPPEVPDNSVITDNRVSLFRFNARFNARVRKTVR